MGRSTRTRATNAAALLALAIALVPSVAAAQDKNAEDLFQLGKTSMASKDFAKACGYFQASLNAEFALGTLLNLAICHEQAKMIASAWSDYRLLEDKARAATPPQAERAKYAHEHAELLRPRLSRMRIIVAADAKALSGLTVKIDGVVAQPELYDVGVPVDIGKHTVVATAPEHDDSTQTIGVDEDKQRVDVTITALKASPVAPPPPAVAGPKTSAPPADSGSNRTIGYVVGGIGAASLVAGGVFGLLALGASKDAKCEGCVDPSGELDSAKSAYSRANTFGWVSNIAVGVGIVGLGIGTVLVLTSGSGAEKKTARLLVSPNGIGIGGTL